MGSMTDIHKAFGRPRHDGPNAGKPKFTWRTAGLVALIVGGVAVFNNLDKIAAGIDAGVGVQLTLRGPTDEEVIRKFKAFVRPQIVAAFRTNPLMRALFGGGTPEEAADRVLAESGDYVEDKAMTDGDTFVADVVMRSAMTREIERHRVTMKRGPNGWQVVGHRPLE